MRVPMPDSAPRRAEPSYACSDPGRAPGFTLVELMIVVAIVAILAVIAIPAYGKFILTAHRTDAQRVLAQDSQILERSYTQNFSYSCTGVSTVSPNSYYNVTCSTTAGATPGYTLIATATGSQAADTGCYTFQVIQTGQQTAADNSGNPTTTTCWGSN